MKLTYTLPRLLKILGDHYRRDGSYDGVISGIASLDEAQAGDLSFLGNPKYRPLVAGSQASVILVPEDYEEAPADGQLLIRIQNPSYALALVCRDIEGTLLPKPPAGIHPSAVVEAGPRFLRKPASGRFVT